MLRRDVIRLVGGGFVAAAVTGCTPAGPDPRAAWVDPGSGETDVRRKALAFAILAPSPHNMQPWMADLAVPDVITLYVDPQRLLPVTDPFNRQIVIGCGAFLDLLRMALAAEGRGADIALFPEGEPTPNLDGRSFARVTLTGEATPDSLFAHVLARRTNREAYAKLPVAPADASAVVDAARTAGPDAGATVDKVKVAALRALVYAGANVEAHTPAAHRESVERTFIGAADVAAHPWGISLDAPVMSAMHATGLLTKAKMEAPGTTAYDESLKFLKTAADTAAGFVWIVTPGETRADEIHAGQAYLRANLAAAGLGLAMHPWSQGLQEYGTQDRVRAALHRMLAPGGGRIQMLARIGKPKSAIRPAPRRGLAAQIRNA